MMMMVMVMVMVMVMMLAAGGGAGAGGGGSRWFMMMTFDDDIYVENIRQRMEIRDPTDWRDINRQNFQQIDEMQGQLPTSTSMLSDF